MGEENKEKTGETEGKEEKYADVPTHIY